MTGWELFFNNLQNGKVESWIMLIIAIVGVIIILKKLFKLLTDALKKMDLSNLKSIKTPFGEAEFDTDEDDKEKKPEEENDKKSPHSDCPHAKDIVKTLQLQRKNIRKADKAELYYIPRDLMNTAQDVLDNIVSKMESIFLTLLKEKHGNKKDLVTDKSYRSYVRALQSAKRDLLDEVLRMVKENNFIEKEIRGTFNEYKKTKAQKLFNMMTKSLNKYYFEDDPSREEVYDKNMSIVSDPRENFNVLMMIEGCIEEMKELSKVHNSNIDKFEKEVDDRIIELFGE